MNTFQVSESAVLAARAADIYAVLADYHVGHPAILPRPAFTGLTVEQGGVGAGTVFRAAMTVWGQHYSYHQRVSEPEPGRVLQETDLDTGQYTRFILEPLDGGARTKVTILSVFPAEPGLRGWMQRLVQPGITRRIYRAELDNLAQYVSPK